MGSAAILKAIGLNPSPHLVINLLGDVTLKVLNDRVRERERNFDYDDNTSVDGWAEEERYSKYISLGAEMRKQKDQVDEQQLQLTWFMQKVASTPCFHAPLLFALLLHAHLPMYLFAKSV